MARDARRRSRCRAGSRSRVAAGQRAASCGAVRGAGHARLPRGARRLRRARPISAAARPSRSASSAATAGARCARATCCTCRSGDADRATRCARLPQRCVPRYRTHWEIGVLVRPARRARLLHARRHRDVLRDRLGGALQLQPHRRAPDRPEAARGRARDGGEAGLHPSNIHDNAYAIGSDRLHRRHAGHPRPDGPSLGGFVCPATIVAAELWKIGQLQARRHGALPRA